MRRISLFIALIIISFSSYSQIVFTNDTIVDNDKNNIGLGSLNNLPFNAGEIRLVDVLDLLPGIQKYKSNSNLFSALGSPHGQNWIAIDHSPMLLSSNMVLNTLIIDDMVFNQTLKPLKYNNSNSSATEIGIRGNIKETNLSGQITPISAQISGAIPVTGSSALVFSANYQYGQLIGNHSERYSKLYSLPFVRDGKLTNQNYDFLAKYQHQIGKFNSLSFTYYGLNETLGFDTQTSSQTTNLIAMKWLNTSNANLIITNAISWSGLNNKMVNNKSVYSLTLRSKYENIRYHFGVDQLIHAKHQINYGINLDHFGIVPNNMEARIDQVHIVLESEKRNSLTFAAFAMNRYQVNDQFYLNIGLKYSAYTQIGPGTQFDFESTFTDTLAFEKGEIMQFYQGLNPSLRLNWEPINNTNIALEYLSSIQFTNSLNFEESPYENSFINNSVIIPATNNVKPIRMNSIYLTLSQNIQKYKLMVMPFYRQISGLIEAKEGVAYAVSGNYEKAVVFGSGQSYGITTSLQKAFGKMKGWVNYTYLHSTKTFDEINMGREYNAENVARHNGKLVVNYDVSQGWNISSVFRFYSGNYVTLPVGYINYVGARVPIYPDRNSATTPVYYRFDLAINRTYKTNKLIHHFSLGFFNLFGSNTVDIINGYGDEFLLGVRPYLKYRFEL